MLGYVGDITSKNCGKPRDFAGHTDSLGDGASQAPSCRPGLWEPGGSCLDGFSMEFVVLGPAKRRNERHDEGYTYLILLIRKQRCRSNHPFENPPYISELSLD